MYGKNIKSYLEKYYPLPNTPSVCRRTRIYPIGNPDGATPPDTPYFCIGTTYRDYNNSSFTLFTMGIDHTPPNYSIVNRSIPHYIFNCIIGGKGTFNGMPFSRGTCFYTHAGECHTMISDADEPWQSVWFAMTAPMGKKLAELLDQQSTDHMFQFSHVEELEQLFSFLLLELGYVQNSAKFTAGVIELIASYLKHDAGETVNEPVNISARQREIVQKSVDYIEADLAAATVTSLAEKVHLETKYFSKIFTLVTGISPKQYIINSKMEMAAHYLSSTDYSMEDITTLLGYNHRNSLTTTFKRTFDMSPADYRAKQKNLS